jgi:drug/metabolite transporter (DMT)-like permease
MNQSGRMAAGSMGPFEWLLLVTLSVLWGGSFFFSKVALYELPPFTVVLARVGLAAVVLNLVVIASGHRMPFSMKIWGLFFVMGVINNLIPFSLIFWGQTQISSSLASILNATTPIWTVVLAHFLTADEKLTTCRLLGAILGFGGVVVMIGPDALAGLRTNVLAQTAVIGAAVSYAFAGIFGKRFKGLPPYVIAAGQITSTTLAMIPIVLWFDHPWLLALPGLKTWGALLGLALLSTSVAYVIYFRLLAKAGATNLLLVTFLIPVSALFLGMTILSEKLDLRHFVGMLLIGLGLSALDARPWTFIIERMRLRFGHRQKALEDYMI